MGRLYLEGTVECREQASWAAARILEIAKFVVARYSQDVIICAAHGEAFDFRLPDRPSPLTARLLKDLSLALGPRFYVWLDAANTPHEQVRCQRTKGTTYTALEYLRNA